ncbi:MAG TPA: mobile mystery protein A [Coleofasciculaceae cyanobacterium]|jgi:predicted DNA-binding mobile mystery protein A
MARNYEAARRHLDERFAQIGSPMTFTRPLKGWIRAIRDALGMSSTQLARRLGVPQSRVVAIEKGELSGALTLNTLYRVADAMDCQLVYALVPKDDLSLMKIVEFRAYDKARAIMDQTRHTMSLEEQSVKGKELAAQFHKLTEKILQDSPRKLWDEP